MNRRSWSQLLVDVALIVAFVTVLCAVVGYLDGSIVLLQGAHK